MDRHRRQTSGDKEGFNDATELEPRKAVNCRSEEKVPGPDGVPVEVYSGMPVLLPLLTQLFNIILSLGRFPQDMLVLYIVPQDKLRNPRALCGSKRPTFLRRRYNIA